MIADNDPRLITSMSLRASGQDIRHAYPYTIRSLAWARTTAKFVATTTSVARVVVPGLDHDYTIITLEQWAASNPLLEAIAAFDANGNEFNPLVPE